jgi:hypothetical protein
MIENHKYTFAIDDIGAFDLDQDRSIVPSIKMALKVEGIEADVDGEEHNQAIFTVYTRSTRDAVEIALKNQDITVEA